MTDDVKLTNYWEQIKSWAGSFYDSVVHQIAPAPLIAHITIIALVLCVFFSPIKKVAELLVTSIHEAGHGFVGWLFGKGIHGIHIQRNASGHTVTESGGFISTTFITLAGYTAPPFLALVLCATTWSGYLFLPLILLLVGSARLLLESGNWLARLVNLSITGAIVGLTFFADGWVQSVGLLAAGYFLAIGGMIDLVRLPGIMRQKTGGTDPEALQQRFKIPAMFWYGVMLLLSSVYVSLLIGMMFTSFDEVFSK